MALCKLDNTPGLGYELQLLVLLNNSLYRLPLIDSYIKKRKAVTSCWLSAKERSGAPLVVQWIRLCQCRAHRFDSFTGKIPHAPEQLSPCTRLLSPRAVPTEAHEAHTPTAHCPTREATTARSPRRAAESSSCLPRLERAHVQHEDPQINEQMNKGKAENH